MANGKSKQCTLLSAGIPCEKLEVLKELYVLALECRARTDALPDYFSENPTSRESKKPWRELLEIVGQPLFDLLVAIVQQGPPSEVRDLAGDILSELWHPGAIGRLLQDYERNIDAVAHTPPLAIYKNLGGIGTDAAARALIWLWGGKWDADIAAALGMCDTEVAQEFLIKQAREHCNVHVRATCIGYLNSPVTTAKAELLLERLENGEYNERFYAIYKINILRLTCAVTALRALRRKTKDTIFTGLIDETLPLLGQ